MHAQGRVALITGAGSGIGREIARQLAKDHWQIGAIDVDEGDLGLLAEQLRRGGSNCRWAVADVTDAEALHRGIAALTHALGAVDLAIACAGVADETPGWHMETTAINKVIGINLIGVSNMLASVIPDMIRRRQGHVVAVSSMASYRGLPTQMAYCASKAGVNAFMESLRLDVKDCRIDVTTVCPGWTRTTQTQDYQASHLLSVEDTARQILWAIRRKKRFHAFPWHTVWQLRLLTLLPRQMQDWLLCQRLQKVRQTDFDASCNEVNRPSVTEKNASLDR